MLNSAQLRSFESVKTDRLRRVYVLQPLSNSLVRLLSALCKQFSMWNLFFFSICNICYSFCAVVAEKEPTLFDELTVYSSTCNMHF